jgi:hypothetical protein
MDPFSSDAYHCRRFVAFVQTTLEQGTSVECLHWLGEVFTGNVVWRQTSPWLHSGSEVICCDLRFCMAV